MQAPAFAEDGLPASVQALAGTPLKEVG